MIIHVQQYIGTYIIYSNELFVITKFYIVMYMITFLSDYSGHSYPIWCMDTSVFNLYTATGSHDRTAKLWSLDRTFPLRIYAGHFLDVNVCFLSSLSIYICSYQYFINIFIYSFLVHKISPKCSIFSNWFF